MKKISLVFILFVLFSTICGCSRQEEKWSESEYDVGADEGNEEEKENVLKTETKDKVSKEEGSFIEENYENNYVKRNEEFTCIDGYVIVDGQVADKLALVEENLIVNVSAEDSKEEMNGFLWGKSLYGNGYLTLSYHYIKGSQIYKLNDFYKEIKMFDIASSGNAIAYYTENSTINLLNAKDGAVEEITCVRGNRDYGIVVSPDGKTVAYSNGKSIYMYKDGLLEEVYTHYSDGYVRIISVTDDGKDIFYYDNLSVWCKSRGKEEKKIVEIEDCRAIITNGKKTQLGLYGMNDSSMSLYIYDTESEKLSRINCIKGCYPLAGYSENMSRGDREKLIAKLLVSSYDVDDLFDCYYSSGNGNGRAFYSGLYYIENYEMKELVSSRIHRLSALSDNQWLCLDDTQRLFIYDEERREKDIHEGVVSFTVGTDNKTVYFITKDNELYRYTTNEKNKIASDVSFYMSNICVVGSDIVIWQCIEDDTPIPIGGDYFIYQDGKVKAVDKTIEYSLYNTNLTSTYINPSIRILETGTRGRLFTTFYLPYMQDGELYILYGEGKREHITRE